MTDKLRRYVPLLCWVVAAVALILIPFKILSYGYVPGGDLRRHAAQAVSQRPYTEVLVMRPEYTMDHSPGWGWILRRVHEQAGCKVDALAGFSVAGLMLALFLTPMIFQRRPEAWIAALLAITVAIPELPTRWTQGRPFILTIAILACILLTWSRSRTPSRGLLALTSVGITLSVWIHGAWYLWALPVAAFALAGWWGAALQLAACSVAGVIAGASLSGHPIALLSEAWFMASSVSHQAIPKWMLVGEFQPSTGEAVTLLLLGLVFVWRRTQNKSAAQLLAQPVFCMAAIGWILGLYADRFWADWGLPAAVVWMALQFEDALIECWPADSLNRLILAGLAAAPLFLHTTNDLDRRYTRCLDEFHLDARNPELQGWLPEAGGIFYAADMGFFYNTYYYNPQAPWRYVVGYEPALMLEDDWKVFRSIQASGFAAKAFKPWVEKMGPGDRLAIYSAAEPAVAGAEWKHAGGGLWIGRKSSK